MVIFFFLYTDRQDDALQIAAEVTVKQENELDSVKLDHLPALQFKLNNQCNVNVNQQKENDENEEEEEELDDEEEYNDDHDQQKDDTIDDTQVIGRKTKIRMSAQSNVQSKLAITKTRNAEDDVEDNDDDEEEDNDDDDEEEEEDNDENEDFELEDDTQMMMAMMMMEGNQTATHLNDSDSGCSLPEDSIRSPLLQMHNYSCVGSEVDTARSVAIGAPMSCSGRSSSSSSSGCSSDLSPVQSPNARKPTNGSSSSCTMSAILNRSGSRTRSASHNRQTMSSAISATAVRASIATSSHNRHLMMMNAGNKIGSSLSNEAVAASPSGRGSRSKPITELHLTEEERRLLCKEGYSDFPVGANLQLTKSQEKVLRKIRRKIRNKRSAQCSRQRKKEYLEELERKYQRCNNENQTLRREMARLQRKNDGLVARMRRLMAGSWSGAAAVAAAAAAGFGLAGAETTSGLAGAAMVAGASSSVSHHHNRSINDHQRLLSDPLFDHHHHSFEMHSNVSSATIVDPTFEMPRLPFEQMLADGAFDPSLLNDSMRDQSVGSNGFASNEALSSNRPSRVRTNRSDHLESATTGSVKGSLFVLMLSFLLFFIPFLR